MRLIATTSLAAVLLLTACAPALRAVPDDARVEAPATWSRAATAAPPAARWWEGFGNAALNRYVEAALARNANLQAAGARVAAARAQLALADAALVPSLSAGASLGANHTLTTAGITTSRTAQPQLQAAWEPDLWGRLSQRQNAAAAQLAASQADRDGVALAVAAATAQAAVDLLARGAQLAQTRKTAELRRQALELARDQQAHGYISRLLAGELPAAGDPDEAGLAAQFQALALPPAPGLLPSELLSRRPDLAQAEAQLAASDASLRASRAAFLPSVQLSASLGGLYANALRYDPIKVWSLGGSVLAPLFDGGRLDAQYDAATAQRDQAAYAYRGAVLAAFGEVEDALVGTLRLREQLEGAERRRAVLERSFGYAQDRYQAGYSSYLEQLDAQRNLYQSEIEVITLRQSRLQNVIALYKALGGGWRQ